MFEYKSSQVVKEYWRGEWVEVSEVGSISCSVFSTDIIKFNSFSVVHFEIQKKKKSTYIRGSLLIGKLRGEIRV